MIVFYFLIGSLHYTRMDAISFASLVFTAMEDGFSHPVDVFFALVLALSQIDTGDHFVPSLLAFEVIVLLPLFVLFLVVLSGSLLLLLFFSGSELLELCPGLSLSFVLIVPLFVLHV